MSEKFSVGPHLGKVSKYKDQYDASLLVGIDRRLNRDAIGYTYVDSDQLPFRGVDIWNAYEVSGLLANGFPFVGSFRFGYDSMSPRLVESKSLKLYLNSYNQTKLGDTVEGAKERMGELICRDLKEVVGSSVELDWVEEQKQKPHLLRNYFLLEAMIPPPPTSIYAEDSSLLDWKASDPNVLNVRSELLRSRCRQTAQPDWGDVFISIKGRQLPTLESLLKLIISYRQEMHFHEEIVESLFYHLYHQGKPIDLMVMAQYTRRGGVDINPIRYNAGGDGEWKSLCALDSFVRVGRQ